MEKRELHKHTILVLTDSGCEEACQLEIGRWLKSKTARHLNVVELQGTLEDAAVLGYRLQTARRVLLQLTPPLADPEDVREREPDEAVMREAFPESLSFKAEGDVLFLRADSPAEAPFAASQELVETIGGWMHRHGRTVKLGNPDVIVYAITTPERTYVGLDVVGRPLAKREYRIMLSRRSLKATIAAAVVLYSGAKPDETILDPIGDDGTLTIEAALLFSRTSPQFFARHFAFHKFPAFEGQDWGAWKAAQDKREEIAKISAYAASLQEMKAIRTNAKLAGVEKDIHATKITMDWLDLKLEENGVDRIITQPIVGGKSMSERQAAKLIEQLFYQAEYVLRKGKTMTCISEKPDELLPAAEKHGFSLKERRDVLMGKRRMAVLTFKNNKSKST